MHFFRHFYQVLALTLSCMLILLIQYPSSTYARPQQRIKRNTSGHLSVSVVRKSVKEFLEKTSHPEETIEELESRTNIRTLNPQTHSREPTWFSKQGTSYKKLKRRSRRKRQKRGAKVNTDESYISNLATNKRVYKYCNKLGFFLRLNADGTVDGTTDQNDPNTILWLESHGRSIIRIRGHNTNRYLTMNQRGKPSAELHPHLLDSLFRLTEEENAWDTIASYRYYFEEKFDMVVGITRDATVKQPWKASPGQYATQFLPIHSTVPYHEINNPKKSLKKKQ